MYARILRTPLKGRLHGTLCGKGRRPQLPHAWWSPHQGVPYNDFIEKLEKGQIEEVHIRQGMGEIVYTDIEGDQEKVLSPVPRDLLLTDRLVEQKVPVYIDPVHDPFTLQDAFAVTFQIVLLGAMFQAFMMSRNQAAGGGKGRGIFSFGTNKGQEVEAETLKTRFDDVAGVENAKRDLQEIVHFLKNPEKYSQVGAKVPKGVLLVGMPGTGKTLMAKAVAGEAGVPFFQVSASSFIELFVGTGAARVRDLFEKAREKAPCIVFIDELDAVGRARNSGQSPGSNDEREQTINQLLTVMDGFEENTGVIVLAATNRPDILDEALLRPGRFDRKVVVELPDVRGRTDILRIHTQGKPLADNVDLEAIARNTVGFSGADLANLANEAAIYAARAASPVLTPNFWDLALEKVTLGEERRTLLISEEKRKITAYHEAGHALMGILLDGYDKVRKVSIVPRGQTGGVTYFEPNEDRIDYGMVSQQHLLHQMMVALGGRISEEIVFGKLQATTGASGDLSMVSEIAYHFVASYGFNETLSCMNWAEVPVDVSADIASEMRFLVDKCYEDTFQKLLEYEFYLHRIARALLEKETLDEHDLQEIMKDAD